MAVELVQKDYNTGDHDDFMPSLQRRHYNYLEGMKNCIFELYLKIRLLQRSFNSNNTRSEAITS